MSNGIMELRKSKSLSRINAAKLADISPGAFWRIEAGTGKTTDAEIASVLKALKAAPAPVKALVAKAAPAAKAPVAKKAAPAKAPVAKKAAAPKAAAPAEAVSDLI